MCRHLKSLSHQKRKHIFWNYAKKADPRARKTLIEYNMRLVAILQKIQWEPRKCDLISAGTIGLIKAIDTYDSKKENDWSPMHPDVLKTNFWCFSVRTESTAREVSLFEPIGTDKEGNEISLVDIISPDTPSILDFMVHDYNLKQLPDCMLHHLTKQEMVLLSRRYGLSGEAPCTQKEIASAMGISRSYVSRIGETCIGSSFAKLSKPDLPYSCRLSITPCWYRAWSSLT